MSVNSANQFIGSKISLISKSDIRYEGVLYALDLREATISLAKVKSFGTEDRPTERPIPSKDEVYEFIIFRGSDIKSIDVLEPPKAGSNMPCGLPQDPAIIEVSHFRSSSMGGGGHSSHNCNMDHVRYSSNRGSEGVFDGLLRGGNGGGRNNHGGNNRRTSNEAGIQADRRNGGGRNFNNNRNMDGRSRQDGYRGGSGGNGSRAGQGNTPNRNNQNNRNGGGDRDRDRAASGNRQNRQRGIIEPQQPPKVTFDDHFDFEKSNEELKTAMEKLKIAGGDNDTVKEGEASVKEEKKDDPITYYDKDQFFDNISCEALERSRGKVGRVDWQAERKMNAETFGLQWNPNHPRNQRNSNNNGRNNGYRPRSTSRNGGYRGGNNQMRYNNYNNWNNYNNRNNGYGNRGQQMRI